MVNLPTGYLLIGQKEYIPTNQRRCRKMPGGYSVSGWWYTGMLKGFWVLFRNFWYIDRWVSDPSRHNAPNLQNWVHFGKIWPFCYTDESLNHTFRGIEMVEIQKSTFSIHVQILWSYPPPPIKKCLISLCANLITRRLTYLPWLQSCKHSIKIMIVEDLILWKLFPL